MHWYFRVYDEMEDWTAYCVWHPYSEYSARLKLFNYITDVEGYIPNHIDCEMWDTHKHGDISDYEVLS